MPTPEQRREVIRFTGLCMNENCTAHDCVVDRILALIEYAVTKATNIVLDKKENTGA